MLCDVKSNKAATAVHHISAEKWHRSDTADHEAFSHSINESELRVSHPTHRLPLRGVEDPPLQSLPLLPACLTSYTQYTRSAINAMFKGAAEVLGCQLVTIHNIAYMLRLTRGMRQAIMEVGNRNFTR